MKRYRVEDGGWGYEAEDGNWADYDEAQAEIDALRIQSLSDYTVRIIFRNPDLKYSRDMYTTSSSINKLHIRFGVFYPSFILNDMPILAIDNDAKALLHEYERLLEDRADFGCVAFLNEGE